MVFDGARSRRARRRGWELKKKKIFRGFRGNVVVVVASTTPPRRSLSWQEFINA